MLHLILEQFEARHYSNSYQEKDFDEFVEKAINWMTSLSVLFMYFSFAEKLFLIWDVKVTRFIWGCFSPCLSSADYHLTSKRVKWFFPQIKSCEILSYIPSYWGQNWWSRTTSDVNKCSKHTDDHESITQRSYSISDFSQNQSMISASRISQQLGSLWRSPLLYPLTNKNHFTQLIIVEHKPPTTHNQSAATKRNQTEPQSQFSGLVCRAAGRYRLLRHGNGWRNDDVITFPNIPSSLTRRDVGLWLVGPWCSFRCFFELFSSILQW